MSKKDKINVISAETGRFVSPANADKEKTVTLRVRPNKIKKALAAAIEKAAAEQRNSVAIAELREILTLE